MKNRKSLITLGIAFALTAAMSLTAFAYGWQPSEDGRWRYGTNADDTAYYNDGWQFIDGNFYYFYDDGYMATDTTIDGLTVNSDGIWVWDAAIPQNDTAMQTANLGNYPVLEGLYYDRVMQNYFLLSTDADGTIHMAITDENRTSPRPFYDCVYDEDNYYDVLDTSGGYARLADNGQFDMYLGRMTRSLVKVN